MFDLDLTYNAPPTLSKFMTSPMFGRLVGGPVGSGKTHAFIIEILRRAMEQAPAYDGRRYTRGAIIRQTLTQLKSTVLKDLLHICKGHAEFISSKSEVHIKNDHIDCEIMLVPLEDPKDQQRLLSSQLTWAWFSEVIEIDRELVGPVAGRIGRYPNGDLGAPSWSGMMADTNFPVEGSAWWDFMENPPVTWQVFKQPGGLDDDAENLQWLGQTNESLLLPESDPFRIELGRQYYRRLLATGSKAWGDRYVHARYGVDPSGTAVFANSFKRSFHVRDELEPVPGRMLVLGQDFGRNPWSLICQLDHRGRLLVLEEVPGVELGLDLHLTQNLRPALMQERYLGMPLGVVGDPAGKAKSSLFEINEYDLLRDMGFSALPAPTNDIEPRIRAVEKFLLGQRDGAGEILIDAKRCPKLVFALGGGYRFEKTKKGELKPKPDKNEFSHVSDCLQYVCLVAGNPGAYSMLRGRAFNRSRARGAEVTVGAWT
ncbi:MAG: terminase [Patescibacteria group bacterium]|nr:terminase [Patescibacteria group bacterium]